MIHSIPNEAVEETRILILDVFGDIRLTKGEVRQRVKRHFLAKWLFEYAFSTLIVDFTILIDDTSLPNALCYHLPDA